jgi:hypothetical protein
MANSNDIMDKLFIKGTLGRHYLALFFYREYATHLF